MCVQARECRPGLKGAAPTQTQLVVEMWEYRTVDAKSFSLLKRRQNSRVLCELLLFKYLYV